MKLNSIGEKASTKTHQQIFVEQEQKTFAHQRICFLVSSFSSSHFHLDQNENALLKQTKTVATTKLDSTNVRGRIYRNRRIE